MKTLFKKQEHIIHKLDGFIDNSSTQEGNHSVNYRLFQDVVLTPGQAITIRHQGHFECTSCAKKVKKLFSNFCFPCLRSKAEADLCIVNPHQCHFLAGTCREPRWGEGFCYQPHFVYISFTDKFKVGITRKAQVPTRWIDQGATAAALLAEVSSRHQAGHLEKLLTQILKDKSHWQKMLLNANRAPSSEEFLQKFKEIVAWLMPQIINKDPALYVETPAHLQLEKEIRFFEEMRATYLHYPLEKEIPAKFTALDLEKTPLIEGVISGIKGQYLLLGDRALNMRKHCGFVVDIEVKDA